MGGGGSSGSRSAGSTGWMVGLERETWRGDLGAAGGGYSGVRCVADDRRLRTLDRRPPDSEAGTGLVLEADPDDDSEDPTENRLDSRWADFFLSPNMARLSITELCGEEGRGLV